MVDSILIGVSWVRMVAAWAHWHTMLRDVEMRVIGWAGARWARAVNSIGSCTAWNHNVLTVLERCRCIGAHDVAQVWWHVRCANLRVWHDAVDDSGIACGSHIILSTLVATVRVAWMVGMVGGGGDHASIRTCTRHWCRRALSVMIHLILLRSWIATCIISSRVASIAAVWGIILFTWLRTDASKSS